MVATITLKQCTSTNAATETTSTNWNMMSTDAADASGTEYQTNKVTVPSSGTVYSYERWLRFVFSSTFNLIDNIKCWKSTGTHSDVNLSINAGETTTGVTPVTTLSSVAGSAIPTVVGSAIDITPTNAINVDGEKTDYLVTQLVVPSTVTTPGNSGIITLSVSYDES